MPAYVVGTIQGSDRAAVEVAVAVNGTLRGTARVAVVDGQGRFYVRIPPSSWEPGRNAISLYEINRDEAGVVTSLSQQ